MIGDEKHVDFDKWCETCKWKNMDGWEEPCIECLDYATNTDSTKPVMWEERKKNSQEKKCT